MFSAKEGPNEDYFLKEPNGSFSEDDSDKQIIIILEAKLIQNQMDLIQERLFIGM